MAVKQFAVLGAGVMGSGIAYQAVVAGIPTRLCDLSQSALTRGLESVRTLLERQYSRQRIDAHTMMQAQSCLMPQCDQQGFTELDLLVEAVVESSQIKIRALQSAESACSDSAILATNTSTISIDLLAQHLKRAQQFCGLHFFNPVAQMQLVEVVQGSATSQATLDSAVAFARQLNKQPIVVQDCPGFLVNRILFPYFHGFDLLLKEGVSFERVDEVMQAFGWPMGPAYLADVIGMDVMVGADRVLEVGYPDRMSYSSSSIFEKLFEAQMLGQKTGSGFYRYTADEAGQRQREPNPAVRGWLPSRDSVNRISDEEIHWRMMLPMLNEALRALDEGVVASTEDLSLAARLGLGFPDIEGGLWGYIESIGWGPLQQMREHYAHLGGLYTHPRAFKG